MTNKTSDAPAASPDEYFNKIVGLTLQHKARLVQAAEGLAKAEHLSDDVYESLWLGKAAIFDQTVPGLDTPTSTRYLYDGGARLEKGSAQYEVGLRFFYLLVANQIELICLHDTSGLAPKLRRSRAVERVSEYSGRTVEEIKSDDQKSRKYYKYLTLAGPGALLVLGREVANL